MDRGTHNGRADMAEGEQHGRQGETELRKRGEVKQEWAGRKEKSEADKQMQSSEVKGA